MTESNRLKKQCPSQSFHFPTFYKGKYFIGCNYYGEIVRLDRCDKCKIKRFFEEPENALKGGER